MSTHRDFDRISGAWLADGPTELADRVLDAALAEVHLTHQRHALRVPWRFPQMSAFSRATAAIVVLVAVVGAGTAIYLTSSRSNPGVGGAPSPSPTLAPTPSLAVTPTPEPSVSLDTTTWTGFTSARYGYAIRYPSNWTATNATRAWTLAADGTNWTSPAQDFFIDTAASYDIGVHAFAVPLPTGMSGDHWIDTYLAVEASAGGSCVTGTSAGLPSISVDGHTGKLADQPSCSDSIAFVVVDQRVFVLTIGRSQQLPLFQAFLSTVRFTPAVASPSPAAS